MIGEIKVMQLAKVCAFSQLEVFENGFIIEYFYIALTGKNQTFKGYYGRARRV